MYIKSHFPIRYYKKKGIKFGENCSITGEIYVTSEPYLVSFGNNCRITDGCKFITHDGGINVVRNLFGDKNLDIFGPIKIGNNVFLGNNVIVLPNVTIGDNVIIAAGAIVTKDIPSNCVAGGCPCKVIETLDEYIHKNQNDILRIKNLAPKEKKNLLCEKYLKDGNKNER